MRLYCSVSGCRSHISDGRLFAFPKFEKRAMAWKAFCANLELEGTCINQLYYKGTICWKHFRVEDFQTPACLKLNRNAVPVLHPPSSCTASVSSSDSSPTNLSPVSASPSTFGDEARGNVFGSHCQNPVLEEERPSLATSSKLLADKLLVSVLEAVKDDETPISAHESEEEIGAAVQSRRKTAASSEDESESGEDECAVEMSKIGHLLYNINELMIWLERQSDCDNLHLMHLQSIKNYVTKKCHRLMQQKKLS